MKVYQFDKTDGDQREAEMRAVDQFRSETGSLGQVTETLTFGRHFTVSVVPYRQGRR